ncbi:cytochrome P450 [Aspergillus parasiticus]|uniref:Cytochrome P450 n=1 Tax=Aspergillus parasiticus TaxID=5067 RepID=A0A5N6DUA8_ASPPA|nr:cytochrome P450 [Aspergillus parasiticus]
MLVLVSLFLCLTGFYLLQWALKERKIVKGLPPGPRPKPMIGNLLDLPPPGALDWLHWLKHKELYGPISSVTIFGQTIIIINGHRVANELMEKRSGVHSSRPHVPIAELAGWQYTLGFVPYDSRLRAYRRALHQEMGNATSISKYHNILDMETHRLLFRILKTPDCLMQHLRKEAGSIILRITYGYITEPEAYDPLIDLVDKAMEDFAQVILPGGWLVNFIPMLKYLPSWFPGCDWQRRAKAFKQRAKAMTDIPYAFVKQQHEQQKHIPSYVSRLLEQNNITLGSEEELVAKWSAQSIYGGGAETSVSVFACFFQVMGLHLNVQKKAQEEIDRVVGASRLPDLSDCKNLPYINAVVKEVLRWHPVAPMGVAHASSKEDIYHGYVIPKGAILVPNIWAMAHDPDYYHNAMEFEPERFLKSGRNEQNPEYDPHQLIFGFGRRTCPGQHLVSANLSLGVARVLAVFNITNAVRDGKKVPISPEFSPGVISRPAPFELSIQVRNAECKRLIEAVGMKFPWEESHAEALAQLKI